LRYTLYYKMNKQEILCELVKANSRQIIKIMTVNNCDQKQAIYLWMKKFKNKINDYLLIHSTE
jgi:hypothetical protein